MRYRLVVGIVGHRRGELDDGGEEPDGHSEESMANRADEPTA